MKKVMEYFDNRTFRIQEKLADENLSLLLNPNNKYMRTQKEILMSIFE